MNPWYRRQLSRAAVPPLLLLLAGAVYGGLWLREARVVAALADHGVAGTATVEEKRIEETRRHSKDGVPFTSIDYLVTFSYAADVDGTPRTHYVERLVPTAIFRALREGQEVEITYLPENPLRADLYPGDAQSEVRTMRAMTLGLVGGSLIVATVIGSFFGTMVLAHRARQRRPDLVGTQWGSTSDRRIVKAYAIGTIVFVFLATGLLVYLIG